MECCDALAEATKEGKEAAKESREAARECNEVTKELRTAAPALTNHRGGSRHHAPPPVHPVSDEPAVGITRHTQPRTSIGLPHPSNLRLLREFTKNESASFTCPEQALALELANAGNSSFFLIGPTGMGKSSIFFITAKRERKKVTIVILPLSGLRIDFAMRCKKHDIDCAEWTMENQHGLQSTIVIVSPENVTRRQFLTWAKNLYNRNLLHIIIYDEVHLIRTHSSFRDCFKTSNRIVGIGEQNNPPLGLT